MPLSMKISGAAAVAALAAASALPAAAYDWLQFGGEPAHRSENAFETAIAPANVASLQQKFQLPLPAAADGAPVLLQGVVTAGGTRDLLFVTTKAGHLVAVDALAGTIVWSVQHGAGSCRINNGANTCYTTSSPALDPNRQYVYTYGLDGYVHRHRVGDGAEATGAGWPALASTKPYDEKGSSALAFAVVDGTTWLYAAHGGYPGDNGDYQGHVTAIDVATGTQHVFNTMCSDVGAHLVARPAAPGCSGTRSAVWARPGVVYDAGTRRLLLATGNGGFNGATAGTQWSESILALAPDATGALGRPLDSYTPANFQALDNADADLGSTAPALLPPVPGAAYAHLAVQAGKDAKLRLVNVADLSGQGAPGRTGGELGAPVNLAQGGEVLTQPATWVDPVGGDVHVFVGNNKGIAAYRIAVDALGKPSLVLAWNRAIGVTSPLVANGLVFVHGGGAVRALDPLTGATLWTSTAVGNAHFQSPVVANGVVYVLDEAARLTAFAPTVAAPGAAAVEYYAAALDHYFITTLPAEIGALDAGRISGWARTGLGFPVATLPGPDGLPVCRFYLPPPFGDTHFFSASAPECAGVHAQYPQFAYETAQAFLIGLPDATTGACPAGALPVYRLWARRVDTNHRYTTSRAVRDQMVAQGWVAEGYGPDAVAMCAPAP